MLLFTLLTTSFKCSGQYVLELEQGGGRFPILFSESTRGDFVRNTGNVASPAFRVRAWASVDKLFQDSEVVWEENFNGLAPISQITTSFTYSTPLDGDNRPLAEIVASELNFRVCVEVPGDVPICFEEAEPVFAPDPPSLEASQGSSSEGVELDFTARTQNGEVPFDYIELTINDQVQNNFPPPARVERVDAVDIQTLSDGQNEKTFRLLAKPIAGSQASFSIKQCFRLPGGLDDCGNDRGLGVTNGASGHTRAVAKSTQGELNDRIRLEWPNYTDNRFFSAYLINRCELNTVPEKCVSILSSSSGGPEAYEDFEVTRGVEYIYTMNACIPVDPQNCNIDTTRRNIARSEVSFIGLSDQFESDDTPSEASSINRSVSQLRSFHTPTDEDWVKVELDSVSDVSIETSSFNGERTDTVLSLYQFLNGDLTLLEENVDANVTAGFSKIDTLRLDPGTYFVKATHFKLIPDSGGDAVIPAPIIPNYILVVSIDKLERPVVMVPILDLLLFEGE